MDTQTIVETGSFAALGPIYKGILNSVLEKVPNKFRAIVVAGIGAVVGAVYAGTQGAPWAKGILDGLVMAGVAAWHHDRTP